MEGLYWPWGTTLGAAATGLSSLQTSKVDVTRDAVRGPLKDQAAKASMMDAAAARRTTQHGGAFADISNLLRPQLQLQGAEQARMVHAKLGGQQLGLPFGQQLLVAHGERSRERERDWVDVDRLNEHDPQACAAYANSIMQHLREAEHQKRPSPTYLEHVQHDINPKMRAILIDWLVEVSEEYKLCADTLYQCVNYIDRFLSLFTAQRSQLQLVGVTCMWLAAKYEEIYPPNVTDFCYITDNTYSKQQLVQMEEVVLKQLDYKLTVPTAKTFLRRLLQVCNPDELLHYLSNYLTELTLLDYSMLHFLPSVIAAAGVYLANLMLKRQPWDANLHHYSGYLPADLSQCVIALAAVHQAVTTSQHLAAIREKYVHAKFHKVSTIPPICIAAHMLG